MAFNIRADDTMQMLLLKSQVVLPNIHDKILDLDTIDFQDIRPILTHDSTSVTKSIKIIQKDLATDLLFVIEKIKRKELNYSLEDVKQIEYIFRNHIQRAYQIGTGYVNNIFKTKGFLEQRDLNIIKYLTDYYLNIFINSIEKILNSPDFLFNIDRSLLDIQQNRLEKSNMFNYIVHSLSATFQALEIATVVKTIVLFDSNSIFRNEQNLFSADSDVVSLEFYWSTSMQEKVCPICTDLSKKTWDINNWYDIPLIPHGSHPHCICRIMVKPVKQEASSSFAAANQ